MKRQIHPVVALVIVVGVSLAAGYLMYRNSRCDTGQTPGIRYAKPKWCFA